MTMIKLENGDYINTGNVTRIYTVNCMDLIGDRGFHDEIRASFGSTSTEITPADRDRIVEAMDTKDSQSIYIDAGKLADIELNDLTRKQRGLSNE